MSGPIPLQPAGGVPGQVPATACPATLTAGPRGSMGEEVDPPIVLLGSDPGDRCHDAVELYGYVQDGIVTVTGERRRPTHEPFVIHVEPDYQADLLRQLVGAIEFNAMQDVYREVATTGVLAYRQAWNDELDRVEIERINLRQR